MASKYSKGGPTDTQIRRASTKAQMGNWVFHTSIATIPNMNIVTAKHIGTQMREVKPIGACTEDGEIPPIWDLPVYGHETGMDIGLFRE
jgi:hypothetical protein